MFQTRDRARRKGRTLQRNLACIDLNILLTELMNIDEIDSQLSQAMTSYVAESVRDALPA